MKEQHNRDLWLAGILYSCVDERQRGHEQYTADHSLGYIIAGSVHLETAQGIHVIEAGSMGLVRRNQLVKSLKVPPSSGAFRAINIIFSQDMLRQYSAAHHIQTTGPYTGSPMVLLPHDPFIKGFFDSLLPYFENPEQSSHSLSRLKSEEAIALLLRNNPLWKDFLFDFSEPYKIDLETFMQQHFTFNVPAAYFARMSGRSLAGFKRDFEKKHSEHHRGAGCSNEGWKRRTA